MSVTEEAVGEAKAGLPLGGRSIAGQVAWLAAPVLVEQAMLYLVGLSDTVLTGRYLGVEQLAAVTVSSYLLWTLGSLMMVVSAGATALVARLIGAGDRAGATRIAGQSIGLAWLVGMAVQILGIALAPQIVGALRLDGLAAGEAAAYLRIILGIMPLLACEIVGVACLRGAGDTRTGMQVMVAVNLVNVGLSWALVVGALGLPRLGLRGVAIGTAAGEGIGGLLILAALARGRAGLVLRARGTIPVAADVRRILRISLPATGESLTNSLCQLWFLGLINGLGGTATAAHGVAIRCEAIAFLTVAAFAVAASTLTGQYLGAGRPDLARRSALIAWGLGALAMSTLGAILYGLAPAMFRLFLGPQQAGVADQGVPVLRIVAFALPALATINVLTGSLRGAGDTRWPWAIVLAGYLLARLPLTYWLILPRSAGGLDWGLTGAWVAMFVDLHIRAALVAARFFQGGWRSVRV
jgi:putative MATE family efflux protein